LVCSGFSKGIDTANQNASMINARSLYELRGVKQAYNG
jgi:phage anti-repressor protein